MTNSTMKTRKPFRALVWGAANSPGYYYLETLERRLDEETRSEDGMFLISEFPEELIAELLEAGICGWFSAHTPEEAEREGSVSDSIAYSAIDSALWRLGYRF